MDSIDPKSAALVIQDLQNDVIIDGGAFADSGAPAHATSQNVVANVAGLAAACRKAGKFLGMGGVYQPDAMKQYIALGAQLILTGSDHAYMLAGANAQSAALRKFETKAE